MPPANLAAHMGEPVLYTYKESTYRVSPWVVDVITQFQRYLERQLMDSLDRVKNRLSPEDYERALTRILKDTAAGLYTFGNAEVGKALQCEEHVTYLFFLCVKINHPEVSLAMVKQMAKDDYQGMIATMNLANADPKTTPKGQQTPAPSDHGRSDDPSAQGV